MNKFSDFKSHSFQIFDLTAFGLGLGIALAGVDSYGDTQQVFASESDPRWGYQDFPACVRPRDHVLWAAAGEDVSEDGIRQALLALGFTEATDLFGTHFPEDLSWTFEKDGRETFLFFGSKHTARNLASGSEDSDNIREDSFVVFPKHVVGDNASENMFYMKRGQTEAAVQAELERLGYEFDANLL